MKTMTPHGVTGLGRVNKLVKEFWSENFDEGDLGTDGCEDVK
jgi:hypothetical protein